MSLDEESKHRLGPDVLPFLRENDGSTPRTAIPSDDGGKDKESHDDDDQDDNGDESRVV